MSGAKKHKGGARQASAARRAASQSERGDVRLSARKDACQSARKGTQKVSSKNVSGNPQNTSKSAQKRSPQNASKGTQKSNPKNVLQNVPKGTVLVCEKAVQCGACHSVNVPYAEQLAQKDAAMRALFAKVIPATQIDEILHPILGMDEPFQYRNKVVSPFVPGKRPSGARGAQSAQGTQSAQGMQGAHGAAGKKGAAKQVKKRAHQDAPPVLTGMYVAGTHHLVNTDGCAVENAAANAVIVAVRRIMQAHGMEPYNEDTGRGFVRHAVVRVGHSSGEMLVTLVTNGEEFPSSKAFCRELVRRCPQVTTVVQNINTRNTNVILGDAERTLYGPGFILDELCGLSFRISSRSFYQVNAVQTEVLYREAIRAAGLTGCETVIDAYCGTGTIGLVAAKGLPDELERHAANIIGVDSVPSAIRDAEQNARHNGIGNARFVAQDATDFMRELAAQHESVAVEESATAEVSKDAAGMSEHVLADSTAAFDAAAHPLVLMMDPPRAGSTPEFLASAARLAPERIVYISCNPQTQVRDIMALQAAGYELRRVQPVDMFPHTPHVECVVLMEKYR